jgi:hypothetical protein
MLRPLEIVTSASFRTNVVRVIAKGERPKGLPGDPLASGVRPFDEPGTGTFAWAHVRPFRLWPVRRAAREWRSAPERQCCHKLSAILRSDPERRPRWFSKYHDLGGLGPEMCAALSVCFQTLSITESSPRAAFGAGFSEFGCRTRYDCSMDALEFREQLLAIMEQKDHWAWPGFSEGLVPADRLHIHLEQEYVTYVRDFPVLVARAYVRCPIPAVRRELIENVYEEETGGLHAGRPHPELFLEYPRGLGMDLARFEQVDLLPAAGRYRALLDDATEQRGWEVSAAVSTLFIEGTRFERGELDPSAPRRPTPPLAEHPLVKHYGLPVERLALTRAHRAVEGDHRQAAWRVILQYVQGPAQAKVVTAMKEALAHWLAYRDEVADACGLTRGPDGRPRVQGKT